MSLGTSGPGPRRQVRRRLRRVFGSEGARVIRTPVRAAPKANAYAERFVRTIRSELLDLVPVLGRRHLLRLLADHEAHNNSHRPYRGIDLAAPQMIDLGAELVPACEIVRSAAVDGLINECRGQAA